MAKCAICEKAAHFGNSVSHSHRRANKMWKANVKSVKVKVNGGTQRMYVCTSCLKIVSGINSNTAIPDAKQNSIRPHILLIASSRLQKAIVLSPATTGPRRERSCGRLYVS